MFMLSDSAAVNALSIEEEHPRKVPALSKASSVSSVENESMVVRATVKDSM